ncbi:hypothetical protein CO662_24900 [Rhizobium anhuiense]|uniref:Phage tail assembly protein n=1 Tax=Rhizobium anhuiense TaxID=1184720 RepID=A0ABX4J1Y1_9HYPH|nr:hypothetical protein [Rhizobium anhuiense]PDS45204.1 hypothetical protein CO668_08845 [Rhizobium anhuiense]PDS49184.1 hypothetical protein CO662_24900 [Rhizobium anhuiense]
MKILVNGEEVELNSSEAAELAASAVVAAPTDYSVPKLTVVQRLTDEEAETVYPAMSAMPAKLRFVWDTASEIRSDSEFFGILQTFLTGAIGSDRAAQVLQPE